MGIDRTHHRSIRVIRWAVRVVVGATVTVGAGGWYASGQLLQPGRESPRYDARILGVGHATITLERSPKAVQAGVWGLQGQRGYGQVGEVVTIGPSQVIRKFRMLQGTLEVGERVCVDPWGFPGDPAEAFGIPYADVTVPSELGGLPGWYVGGSRDTWVLFVHGRAATRREALRALKPVVDLGFPALVLTYRNDREAPASPDGLYHLGETEWKDVDAAAAYALTRGAHHLVLMGFSMGGAIVSEFLHQSAYVSRVTGVVLDSPVLDWSDTVSLVGRNRRVPGPLISLAKSIFSIRYEARWRDLDVMNDGAEVSTPVLLFHGAADETVPVETSDAFAAARPDLVTYVRIPGAGHGKPGTWPLSGTRAPFEIS